MSIKFVASASRIIKGIGICLNRGAEAPRTMIFLDPDMDPAPPTRGRVSLRRGTDAAPIALAAGRVPARAHRGVDRRLRIPSRRTLARFLADAQAAVRLRGRVNVLLTTDAAIHRLNKRFRSINKPTDVLSFPAGGPAADGIAGDLAISIPTARRQGTEQGHGLSEEIKVLILHGLLHLAGMDHETDGGQMARRERLLRRKLGLPLGLIERVAKKPVAKRAGRP